MQNKGALSVFQKHLEREVFNSKEFHLLLSRIEYLSRIHLFRSVLSPIFSLFKREGESLFEAGRSVVGGIDRVAEGIFTAGVRAADKAVEMPIARVEGLFHRIILSTGRKFYPGTVYKGPIPTGEDILAVRKIPETEKEAQKFVNSAVRGARYDDLVEMYAPYSWRGIKMSYSAGELLGVGKTTFNKENRTVEFDVDLYEESLDKIIRKHNVWGLKQTEEGVAVHKAEITDIA